MQAIFLNAGGLFLIILLGFFTKRIGLLQKADGTMLSRIILNITLPAAIVLNMADFVWQGEYLILAVGGVVLTLLQIVLVWPFVRKDSPVQKMQGLFMGSGFNVGNFALPFMQSFLPAGVPLISVFDLGNSIMLAGGTETVIEAVTGQKERFSLRKTVVRLLKTIPFTAYLVMLLLAVTSLNLPGGLLTMLQPVANANAFLSMFMIGLYLELRLPRQALGDVVKILGARFFASLVIFALAWFLPLPGNIRLIFGVLAFAPVPTFGVMNAVLHGAKEETIGFCSSVSFLIALPLMTAALISFI